MRPVTDTPMPTCTGSLLNGADVLATGTGSASVGSGSGVVV